MRFSTEFSNERLVDEAATFSRGFACYPARIPLEKFLIGVSKIPKLKLLAVGTPNAVKMLPVEFWVGFDHSRMDPSLVVLSRTLKALKLFEELGRNIGDSPGHRLIDLKYITPELCQPHMIEDQKCDYPEYMYRIAGLREVAVFER